jgi:hypothetical protein
LDAASSFAFYDPAHPTVEIEMNDLKRRIDEIEAGGVDEQAKLRELETAVARFEGILHQNNEDVKTMPPLPPIAAATRRIWSMEALPKPLPRSSRPELRRVAAVTVTRCSPCSGMGVSKVA